MPRPDPHQQTLSGEQGAMVPSTWFQSGSEPDRVVERAAAAQANPMQLTFSAPEVAGRTGHLDRWRAGNAYTPKGAAP